MRIILTFCFSILFFSQSAAQLLQGVVKSDTGEPLQDVHISVAGMDQMTLTAGDGSFELDLSNSASSYDLIFSRIGYQTRLVSVTEEDFDSALQITLVPAIYDAGTTVVTASRTRRDIEEVSIPVSVVSKEDIQQMGSMRLSDVLLEQTGMQITSDHGSGVQVQGFDPDYTLIMIDGSPVIGRTAGTLDLSRLSVRNIEQIEIVKGPSSALWGSDALAGVINIITADSEQKLSGGFTTRYGQNNTLDLTGDLSANYKSWKNDVFINRNSSSGYSLNASSVSQTVPEFQNYTFGHKTELSIGNDLILKNNFRYFTESQTNTASVNTDGGQALLNVDNAQSDIFINPSAVYTPVSRLELNFNWLYTTFEATTENTFRESGEIRDRTDFRQFYNRPELVADYRWNNKHQTVGGGGLILERLDAVRYPSQPDFTTQFAFAQHTWFPADRFELTAGFRFDAHSEYASQLSPKFSSRFEVSDRFKIRASAGRGFKAPAFRQLFLDFNNSTAGYSVFGSSTIGQGLQRLQAEGRIDRILIPLNNLNTIRAESSWAANLGFDIDPLSDVRLRVNAFRNNVTDLIETAPVAIKTNGQSVFTYFNIDDVITQGFEADISWDITRRFRAAAGYQYLDARRKIVEDKTIQDANGEVIEVTETSYEPMFNRSAHSGNLKFFFDHESGWGANIRGIFRGRFGLLDANGNGFVNEGEYQEGFALWNLAVSRTFDSGLAIQTGLDNALNYRDLSQPNLPGRIWYMQLSIDL